MADVGPGLYAPYSSTTHPGGETPIGDGDYSTTLNVPYENYDTAYWYVFTPPRDGKVVVDTQLSVQVDGVTPTNVEAYITVTEGGSNRVSEGSEAYGGWLEQDTYDVLAGVPMYFQVQGDVYDPSAGTYPGTPVDLVVRVAMWTEAGTTRVVLHDFEGTTLGQRVQTTGTVNSSSPYETGDGALYGGDDWAELQYYIDPTVASADQPHQGWGVYDDHAATGTRSAFFSNVATTGEARFTAYTAYGASAAYVGPRVCGMEVTFKVDPTTYTSTNKNSVFNVELQWDQLGNSSNPGSDFFLTFNDVGIWYGGASGRDATGASVGPGTTLFQGDFSDTMPVDFSRWLTMKLLPTGEYSLAYDGGETLMSGTLVAGTGGDFGIYLSSGSSFFRAANWWLDNVVLWTYATSVAPVLPDVPPPPPPPVLTGRPIPGRRRFAPI